jgi:uncharacterized repeat protein (TIGR01451 family)
MFASMAGVRAQTPPGTVIVNQATVRYIGSSGIERIASSNVVDTVTVATRTSAALQFTRITTGSATYREPLGPAACWNGSSYASLPPPVSSGGTPLDASAVQTAAPATRHHGGEPLFMRLVDPDQNTDGSVRDHVEVAVSERGSGDNERIRLTETAEDSGVFTGYLQTASSVARAGDCVLQTAVASSALGEYVDVSDPADRAASQVAIDPVSRVFDSRTGLPVDGARITLVDAATGLPAQPLSDDGMRPFPATVESGAGIVDGSGNVILYGRGEYRFPVLPGGRYRLVAEPPAGYAAPSQAAVATLQGLANAPFELSGASFGEPFTTNAGDVVAIDIPLDPAAGELFLDKRSSTDTASVGDFVEFRITLSHAGGRDPAREVRVVDDLPFGLRYVEGSARLMPAASPIEPTISADGRTLTFAVGDLAADTAVNVHYVTAVVPGTPAHEVVNAARAFAVSARSNEARAVVRITNDLFGDAAFLAGRVIVGQCSSIDLGEQVGLAGARVYLEDGRFAVSDEGGNFHFEGLRPGAHVAQLDLESLPEGFEVASCAPDARFAGTLFSRFVDLQRGELGRADFHVRRIPPPSGEVSVELEQTTDAQRFAYTATLATTAEIAAEAVQFMLLLPDGVDYIEGSARRADGTAVGARVSGQSVTIEVGDLAPMQRETLALQAAPRIEQEGILETRALARFDFDGERLQTPVVSTEAAVTPAVMFSREYVLNLQFETLSATLRDADREALERVVSDWRGVGGLGMEAVGHTDGQAISARGRERFADNYALSLARANAVVDYMRAALDVEQGRIGVSGVGPDAPIADNATEAGRARNRRVELRMTGVARDAPRTIVVARERSGQASIAVERRQSPLPAMSTPAESAAVEPAPLEAAVPEFVLADLEPGVELLWPEPSFAPAIPSTRVVVEHGRNDQVTLYLNGEPVSALNFEGLERSADRDIALSRWRGVDLRDGPNELVAEVIHEDGRAQRLRQMLHFAGPPVRGEVLVAESTLVADGRTRPSIAVRFVDRWGRPARSGTVGQFRIEAPYRSWWEIERLRENSVIMTSDRTPTFRVASNGIARIELEPTTAAGEVRLHIDYAQDYPQELRTWLRPAAREWILVGLAEGTLGYSAISGSMERANGAGFDDDYYDDGRLAFFAKGRIRGALLTAAFDTEGGHDDDLNPFGGVVDPDRYYTLYGDNTEQRFDAASRERLYLKIEKDAFVAMFGDFETGMTITELSRYSRSLTGFKTEQIGERVSYSAFAAETNQSFIKDELRADGTSGPYQLTRRPILAGSDKLRIEVRDRFRPDRIVSSRALERHYDYDIDYVAGTIYFREPIASRDVDFDPVYIVVDYESSDLAESGLLVGGRAAVALGTGGSEVGMSLVHEGTVGAPAILLGADLRYRLGESSELRAEYAVSDVERPGTGASEAAAYLVEFERQREGRQMQAYVRETADGFGLGQQRANDSGTRRSGVQMRNELSDAWTIDGEAFVQENLRDGASRTVVETNARYRDAQRIGNAGLRRVDEDLGTQRAESMQGIIGGSWKFFDELLTARANLEAPLTNGDASADYPTRTLLGLDLALGPKITLFGEREITDGNALSSRMTRIGARANPTDRSRVDSSYSSEMTEYGPRNFANLGMSQGWNLGEHWVLDLGFERSKLLTEAPVQRFDERLPPASGSLAGDFESGFVGFGYRAEAWSFTNRLELRDSGGDRQRSLISGFYRERTSGRGFSAELNLLDRAAVSGPATFDGRLRLGWARRPADSRWIVFNRTDWVASRSRGADHASVNKRLINNFNAHFLASDRQEVGLQYAVKYVRSELDAFDGTGVLNLIGFDWRRRIDARFDFGLHGSWYQAVAQDVIERGFGADIGFNAARNLLVHFGYNVSGFEDADFTSARYTARGPYLRFSLKIDQASLRDLLRR